MCYIQGDPFLSDNVLVAFLVFTSLNLTALQILSE